MEKYLTDFEYIAASKYFDARWYLKKYPDVAANWKGDPAFHYLESGWKEGRNPSPLFDGDRYLQIYKKSMKTRINPLLHYEKYGKERGLELIATPYILIKNSSFFDARWYKKNYLNGSKEDPVEHYLNKGWRMGNNPGPQFDGNAYLDRYEGVKKVGICPLVHYERSGKKEGRIVLPCQMPTYDEKGVLYQLAQKVVLTIRNAFMLQQIRNKRILICFHLFYPQSWKEIKYYFRNLSIYNCHLVVSYPEDMDDLEVLEEIRSEYPDAEFFPCENRGFDIGPFFEMLNKVNVLDYDIVIKLHSKGIKRPQLYMYGQYLVFKEWFWKLFRGTIGIINAHRTIKKLALDEKIGMVATEDLIVEDPKHKVNLVNMWCEQLGIPKCENYKFVAGTCFAVRSQLLQPMIDLKLTLQDFEVTTRGEFSLAHGLERIICASVMQAGFLIDGNHVIMKKHKKEAAEREKYSPLRLLDDDRFIIDDNFFYRLIEGRQLEKYEVIKMPIKDIRRIWNGRKIQIKECQPYRYLMGYTNEYSEYCDIHEASDLPLMTKERFDALIKSIEEEGFNSKSVIIVNQDNILQDGQHRACYHLYKYGEDCEVNVLKLYYRGQS